MIENKKGLSAIITTLLVILLVLVAVGIVWAVVRNIVQGTSDDVALSAKCLSIDVQATAVNCDTAIPSLCNVTFDRTGSGSDELAGVKLVFRDSTNPDTASSESAIEVIGDIANLIGKTEFDVDSNVTTPDSVEVTVYFEDASGNDQLCPGDPEIFTF